MAKRIDRLKKSQTKKNNYTSETFISGDRNIQMPQILQLFELYIHFLYAEVANFIKIENSPFGKLKSFEFFFIKVIITSYQSIRKNKTIKSDSVQIFNYL